MNDAILEKVFSAVLCGAALVSAHAVQSVEAATTFPPAHVSPDARFAAPDEGAHGPVVRPWYRPDAATSSHAPRPFVPNLRVTSRVAVTPWYRAAD